MGAEIDESAGPGKTEYSVNDECVAGEERHTPSSDLENSHEPSESEVIYGVAQAEAVVGVWSMVSLVSLYISMILLMFIIDLESQTTRPFQRYVLSSFGKHGLISAASVIANIGSGVAKIPIAKISDMLGREKGLVLTSVLNIIGLVIAAASRNVGTYSASQVFETMGNEGLGLLVNVMVADTSSLKMRGLLYAFMGTPRIATTFAGPALAQQFLNHSTWRWGFGTFAILIPAFTVPVAAVFVFNLRKAKKAGLLSRKKQSDHQPWYHVVKQQFLEWDVIGMFLLIAGFTLILLPLTIATDQHKGWRSADIIVMIILGGVLLGAFAVWEKFFATYNFIPVHILKDRTVLGGCMVLFLQWAGLRCYEGYFSSYLQVVHGLSVKNAGYINNTYSLGSAFFSIPIACLIGYLGHCKYVALAMVPIKVLGTGLMIYFRHPTLYAGYVAMCQILISFAEGGILISTELAVLSCVGHENVAVIWAVMTLFQSVGTSVGVTISGAIWTNIFPKALVKHLPERSKRQAPRIYGSLRKQLSFKWGSPERVAINAAYVDAQEKILIASVALFAVSALFILAWRNVALTGKRSYRGLVF